MNEVGTFEIPDDIAKPLSELLIKREIRERLLLEVDESSDRFDAIEKKLLSVIQKINAYKSRVTNEYVPKQFQSTMYSWNYNGYEVDKNTVRVYEN